MPGSVVTCPSCEKKYRIPEGTDVREFTCKACGAEIPLAAEPAAGRAGRRAGGGGRRGRREAPPPKSNTPVIVGAAAGVLVIVVVGILLFGGGGDEGGQVAYQPPEEEGGGIDPNAPKEVVETFVEFDGRDLEAANEVRLFWKNAPKKPPRPPAVNGVVKNEDWEPYQEALRTYALATRQHFKNAAEKAKAFLPDYAGSKYEMEMAKAVLTGLAKAEEYDELIEMTKSFERSYADKPAMIMSCWQKRGDALDNLQRFDEAAEAHAEYYKAAGGDSTKAARAAKKHVQALIRSGQIDEARRLAEEYKSKLPRSDSFINAMLKNISLVGERLRETPGATFLMSDDAVDWGSYAGKVTLILLWSTQYAEGVKAMSDAYKMQERLGDVPFRLVTIVFEEEASEESIDNWFSGHDMADVTTIVQLGRVSQSPVLNAWGLSDREKEIACKLPFTIVLGKDGRVRYMDVPVGPYLEKLIRLANR